MNETSRPDAVIETITVRPTRCVVADDDGVSARIPAKSIRPIVIASCNDLCD